MDREQALKTLKEYNQEPFHLRHAFTVEGVMRWFAEDQGFGDEADFWALVGLLHDVDFERYPDEHCKRAPELLKEAGFGDRFIHAVCSHGYGLCSDVEPEHPMEKILFASDELPASSGQRQRCARRGAHRIWSFPASRRNSRIKSSRPAARGM